MGDLVSNDNNICHPSSSRCPTPHVAATMWLSNAALEASAVPRDNVVIKLLCWVYLQQSLLLHRRSVLLQRRLWMCWVYLQQLQLLQMYQRRDGDVKIWQNHNIY